MSEKYRIRDQQGLCFLTCTVVGWVDVFTRPEYKNILLESLTYCKDWLLHMFKFHGKYRANREEYMFWQDGNHPIELWSPAVIDQKIHYIHMNPVRAGWVLHPSEYVYSSASNYWYDEQGVFEVEVLLPEEKMIGPVRIRGYNWGSGTE